MRTINDHKVNPTNDTLSITVADEPGSGGAHHRYEIDGFATEKNPSYPDGDNGSELVILFQNGPIAEAGVNGVTHEALLAIVADRLRSFQKGPFACKANGLRPHAHRGGPALAPAADHRAHAPGSKARTPSDRPMTLADRIDQLAAQHGSLRAAARALDCDVGYLSRLRSGAKTAPAADLLDRMGLRAVVTYELAAPPKTNQREQE